MTLEEYLKNKYSSTSIRSYINIINRYKMALGMKADTATYTDILDYIGTLRAQQLHPKSLRNHLFTIKIYFTYLIAIGKRNDHPCKYLYIKDQINRQVQMESLYPRAILEELYDHYKARNPNNQRRNKVIISLLIYQALTVLEITQLQKDDIDLEKGILKIAENKSNKGRTLSLIPKQILLFHNYLEKDWNRYHELQAKPNRQHYFILSQNGTQLWKSGINRLLNRNRPKHKKLTPLKIRQSVIAHLLKENKDIRIVQEFAGHRRTASTEAYQQTGLEELKKAIDKYHPLQ